MLFLELNVILAVLKESIQFFLKGCTHHTPYILLVKTTLIRKVLSICINIDNKPFRSNFHASKMQHPITSGGLCPPNPLLQRSTSVFRPPLQKILDPPLGYIAYSVENPKPPAVIHQLPFYSKVYIAVRLVYCMLC